MDPKIRVPFGVDVRTGEITDCPIHAQPALILSWLIVDRAVAVATAVGVVWSLWRIGDALQGIASVAANGGFR